MGRVKEGFWNVFSYVVGFCCLFIGAIELIFGFKCASSETARADASSAAPPQEPPKKAGWFGRATTEPTDTAAVTVNITPAQAAGATTWVANNASTVAAVASAAAPVVADNPFFGNQHLSNQR